jgi:hypothetical protein
MIFFWIGQNGNRVRLEACAGGMTGFELAIEDEGGEGEFLGRSSRTSASQILRSFFKARARVRPVDGKVG